MTLKQGVVFFKVSRWLVRSNIMLLQLLQQRFTQIECLIKNVLVLYGCSVTMQSYDTPSEGCGKGGTHDRGNVNIWGRRPPTWYKDFDIKLAG